MGKQKRNRRKPHKENPTGLESIKDFDETNEDVEPEDRGSMLRTVCVQVRFFLVLLLLNNEFLSEIHSPFSSIFLLHPKLRVIINHVHWSRNFLLFCFEVRSQYIRLSTLRNSVIIFFSRVNTEQEKKLQNFTNIRFHRQNKKVR